MYFANNQKHSIVLSNLEKKTKKIRFKMLEMLKSKN